MEDGGFLLRYFETPFPIDPRTWPVILRRAQTSLEGLLAPEDLDLLEFESIISALENLPAVAIEEPSAEDIELRHREQVVSRHRLDELCKRCDVIGEAIGRVVDVINGDPEDPRSFDTLDHLIFLQPYRLSYWRVAAEEINYRRFFAINTLAAIRQEEPAVFEETHRLLIALLAEGTVDGVRFDHPDGLWNPEKYFHDVQVAYLREAVRRRLAPESDEEWDDLRPEVDAAVAEALTIILDSDRRWPVYVVAEKILEHGEVLPERWALAGTVGYEFAQATTGLFVDPEARALFDSVYARFTGDKIRFPDLVYEMKQRMMREAFPSEVNVLSNVLNRISEQDRHSRDFTLNNLRVALREVMACFSVYRTYTTCDELGVAERDRKYIEAAIAQAKRRNPLMETSVFEFLRAVLLLHSTDNPRERLDRRCHFAMEMQQLTGPVMAKGLEDTAFYRFNRLTSLNEVGGDPAKFGTSIEEFHKQNRARRRDWPEAMINSSTHDTKRSEDVRARISVISEKPAEWRAALNRWSRLNRKLKTKAEGILAPHRADEYVIYQTLIGTWPLGGLESAHDSYVERLQEYIIKVAREASRFTNWVNPDEEYEGALRDFVSGLLDERRSGPFLADFTGYIGARLDAGLINGLAQQILKLTSPGVPDIYQGTEFWDDSLVDPDNRRPVDFDARTAALASLDTVSLQDLVEQRTGGQIKLATAARLLNFRREHKRIFSEGDYAPVHVEGPAADHVVAFTRRLEGMTMLVVVPRLTTKLAGSRDVFDPSIWQGTELSVLLVTGGVWRNVLSGGDVATDNLVLTELFATIPVSVLVHGEKDYSG
jgi:(1->4)-alpha-D-glucan 1-alpha-D-glucosylmutase